MATNRNDRRSYDRALLHALLREDLFSFVQMAFRIVSPGPELKPNWHHELIAYKLMQVARGEIRRLIINVPPRSLKSIIGSVAFPAYLLGHDPTKRIVCVSYSQDLAGQHARACRALMTSEPYRELFPGTLLDPRRTTEADFITTQRGGRLATSIGGTLTGRGGSTIILDDPIKPEDAYSKRVRDYVIEWYSSTLMSRLDDKTTDAIIVIMQRVHIDDLTGHLLRQGGWDVISLPQIADREELWHFGGNRFHVRRKGALLHPEREPWSAVNELKLSLGTANFEAQYQQNPVPQGGFIIDPTWFRGFDLSSFRSLPGDQIYQSWDTALTPNELSDYSACTTWRVRGDDYYLLDVFAAKLDFPSLKRAVVAQAQRYPSARVVVEDKGSGISLIQELKAGSGVKAIAFKPEGDKVMRASAQSARIEAGHVFLPEKAAWLESFLLEVRQFPNGRHDDQVDSMVQFLTYMEHRKKTRVWIGELRL